MNPASQNAFPDRDAGGYAPQSTLPFRRSPEGFIARAAAHRSSLWVALGVGFAIAIGVDAIGFVVSRPSLLPLIGPVHLPASSSAHVGYRVVMEPGEVVCGVNSGVCSVRSTAELQYSPAARAPYAMREYFSDRPAMRVLSAEEIAEYKREAEREEQAKLAALPALTDAQTVALLKMTKPWGAGSTLARGVAAHIQRERKATPVYADYLVLQGHGLCRPGTDSPWHVYTSEGYEAARLIAQAKAKELGLHILIEGSKVRSSMNFSCCCGQWSAAFSRGPNGAKTAYRHWCDHVTGVRV